MVGAEGAGFVVITNVDCILPIPQILIGVTLTVYAVLYSMPVLSMEERVTVMEVARELVES